MPTERDLLGWLTFVTAHGVILVAALGIACIFVLQKVNDLKNTPIFAITRVLVLIDVCCIIISEIHDLPCELAGKEIFGSYMVLAVMLVQCIRFFGELIAMVIVAFLHFLGVYFPLQFRSLTLLRAYGIVACFLLLGFGITAPLLTACCGFVYYEQGSYWSYDFLKDGTKAYSQISLILQGICLGFVIICDVLILRKVYIIRKRRIQTIMPSSHVFTERSGASSHTNVITVSQGVTTISKAPNRFERRIAVAFLLLSLSFLVPTILFNLRDVLQGFFLYNLFTKFSNILEYSKWMVYTLSLPSIRRQFSRTFFRLCQ